MLGALMEMVTGKVSGKRPVLTIDEHVIDSIADSIGEAPIESGGMLGGDRDSAHVTQYHFDRTSVNTGGTYTPNTNILNNILNKKWEPNGKKLIGFIHSHPGSMNTLSQGDLEYAQRILEAIDDLDTLWLLVLTRDIKTITTTAWVATLDNGTVSSAKGKIYVLPNVSVKAVDTIKVKREPTAVLSTYGRKMTERTPSVQKNNNMFRNPGNWTGDEAFSRVRSAYDLERMAATHLIAVGAGGAAEFLEQMARAGVGSFCLIDPDIVLPTNIATQQVYRSDIGRPKVDCIAQRILDINPSAEVITHSNFLDDFDDDAVKELVSGHEGRTSILCGFTDNFHAQARVNRLALKFGIPGLFAQVYREGRGAEVIHTYPGVTPACLRCICSSRYRDNLTPGFNGGVGSDGTPIFATTRLNALKGFVALGIIHHGGDHPRWGGVLNRLGNRNLAIVRMDPDFGGTMGIDMFDRALADADRRQLFFDETLWRGQLQECPETGYSYRCPDCGGTGDLSNVAGIAMDTLRTPLTEIFFEPARVKESLS